MTLANQEPVPQGTIRWQSHGAEVALTTAFVRQHFCVLASNTEAFAFLRFCEAHRLNPFLQDAFLIKYQQGEPAKIVIAAHTWTKRASVDPTYAGHKVGIILHSESGLERREGMFYTPEEKVIGGWAEITKTDGTSYRTELPIQERIAYKKDGSPTQFWQRMPATMIVKCCLSDGMRNAFPVLFAGAYDQAEIGETHLAIPGGLTIEGETGHVVDVETGEITEPTEEQVAAWLSEPDDPEPDSAEAIMDEAFGPSASSEWLPKDKT